MGFDFNKLSHQGIQTLSPYVPGKSTESVAQEKGIKNIIKLASNENPLGCSHNVKKALSSLTAHQLATYPNYQDHDLVTKLANKLKVAKNQMILGNGSDALFPLFLTCFALGRQKSLLTHQYAFISYAIHAQTLGIGVKVIPLKDNWQVDIDAMIAASDKDIGLLFLANPNNPTGSLLCLSEITRMMNKLPEHMIVVLDEAYYEYHSDIDSYHSLSLLESFPNLIITRTFSKAYGLGGMRLGYAVSSPEVMSILHRAQPPFTVNIAAITAGDAAIDDEAFLKQSIHMNQEGMQQMRLGLEALGLRYLPPAGNFITFDCGLDSHVVFESLLQEGIIVRPLHPYQLNQHLRVTIGTKEQNRLFLDKLATCLERRTL